MNELMRKIPGFMYTPYYMEVPRIGLSRLQTGESVPRHTHQVTEVHHIVEGEIALTIRQQRFHVTAGQCYIIHCGDGHSQSVIRNAAVCHCTLLFSKWEVTGDNHMADDPGHNRNIARVLMRCPSCVIPADNTISGTAKSLFALLDTMEPCAADRLAETVRVFLAAIATQAGTTGSSRTQTGEQDRNLMEPAGFNKMQDAARYIEDNSTKGISIQQVADRACMSRRQMERLFRDAIGSSPQQYLVEQRLREAMRLLRESDLKIDGVLEKSGFRSRHHFYRLFKGRTGLSPERYRKQVVASMEGVLHMLRTPA